MIHEAGDRDGDGYRSVLVGGLDCDDADPWVNPDATEVCDDKTDNDCDGFTDDIGEGGVLWYLDGDGDGYGADDSVFFACLDWNRPGWSLRPGDCDDDSPARNPSVGDGTCDEVDDDCDGEIDEDATLLSWYVDSDGDGYGAVGQEVRSCGPVPGSASNDGDCNDFDASVHPGAEDTPYDGADSDCAGDSDYDADGDGFDGSLYGGTDCDDTFAHVFPGGIEACDGHDGDCDGVIDSPPPAGAPVWFLDADLDGFGTPFDSIVACDQPPGYASLDTDCDDTSAAVSPAQIDDDCDGIDNNCNVVADEDVPAADFLDWHPDGDGDGFGAQGTLAVVDCAQPPGHVANADDCDDSDSERSPLATEICDAIDNDCDAIVDEALPTEGATLNGVNHAIADAIVAATPGDAIDVCPGTWDVPTLLIHSGANVTLRGLGDRAQTVLRSSVGQTVIDVDSASLLLSALTLTGTTDQTAALEINASQVTLRDAVVRDNLATGIRIPQGALSSLWIEDSLIEGNQALTDEGGGIRILSDASLVLRHTTIRGNTALGGGGVWFRTLASSSFEMDSCVVSGNEALGGTSTGNGGGVLIRGVDADIMNSEIRDNVAVATGGGLHYREGSLNLDDTILEDNAGSLGGGALISDASAQITNSSFSRNVATEQGGGLAIVEQSDASLDSVSLEDNEALLGGGGLAVSQGSSARLLGATSVLGNLSSTDGGGAFIDAGCSLQSVLADWGAGASDNTPSDLLFESIAYDYAGSATFLCQGSACVP